MDLGGTQTVKVLIPEMLLLLDCAQVLCITEGNTPRREKASGAGAPGVEGRFAPDTML